MQQNRQKDGSHNTENIDEKHHIETYNHKERKLFLFIQTESTIFRPSRETVVFICPVCKSMSVLH